ncbi:MAG: hypothetical protein COW00_05730 [Bdellovibrio sp. CG12_big_fil_rev_8_21_14_0_65_39_13]|nr:MAG: hypothetical protein COW78_18265 [Bdellovibrio sp. CG22_combo_CG10-13_8_21_14_all_39_27]PIQ60731.1 MAG: hypothetical protein COW00_05730 [Bdellovibrio sp. CG12_big_fil_rev_8_21_14_0_65_39_13]PIR36355.1 MAG: hypothetical protein COV37_03065 [Bdellovibrio sp. CG11_big_fil_rev_8_21_14_0_20_39_38]
MTEYWLSLDEYARIHKLSISTLRRRIKSKQVEYKLDNGKYFIKSLTEVVPPQVPHLNGDLIMRIQELECESRELKREIVNLQKQNDDLSTLVSYYENSKESELVLEKF